MKSIDLSISYDNGPYPVEIDKETKRYPSFRYEGDTPLELPHEGKMTVTFKKVASEQSERNGKTHYSCTIEVQGIVDIEGNEEDDEEDEAPTKSYSRAAEDALDTLMKERMKEKKE